MLFDENLDGNNHVKELFVIKRNGSRVPFNKLKIIKAISGANKDESIVAYRMKGSDILAIADGIEKKAMNAGRDLSVEEIQDLVEDSLMMSEKTHVARNYITWRYQHAENRKLSGVDEKILSIIKRSNEEVKDENSNKNPTILSTQRDYMAGEWSRYYVMNHALPKDIALAHNEGIIHFHDTDYAAMQMTNCCLINLEDMLQNGTVISGTLIEKPHRFITACTVTSQISAAVASSQYGGQTITLSHLAPFVNETRKNFTKKFREELPFLTEEQLVDLVEQEVRREVEAGCQTIQYQEITLSSTNGQAPFVTLFMYLDEVEEGQIRDDLALIIETVLKHRIKGVKNKMGVYITPAFPKLIYVLDEDNIHNDSKYYYLTKLAAECTAKRLVPDYISAKIMKELKGDVYPCMGCRSFLTPDRFSENGWDNKEHAKNNVEGKHKYYGRFNQGVVTLNLVDVACSSGKDMDKFWDIMNERLELCHKALRFRHDSLLGTPSDVAPILWQDGAYARLKPGEVIDPLLYGGYSTISLGYAGLAECVYYMLGISHTSEEGKKFGLKVMQALNDACSKWKADENIDYSVYGTPLESTTYKFAKCLQKRFGKIENVTEHNYITNSYHICVRENIDAFSKLTKEAQFQKLSPGGAISYVEVPNMQNNIQAVLAVMKHIYKTILYAELNTKSDYCEACGYDGEIVIKKSDTGRLYWECPNCGNRDETKMHVVRRTCGYIGSNYWNQGRTSEIADRVLHL